MCGIAGVFDGERHPRLDDVQAMVGLQRHRGPDADGWMIDGPLAMGMRRLSIIDLEGGHQPIYNEDRSLAVLFNGEIYNYLELRKDLAQRGHRFATNSDTEVIVHAYEEYGTRFLQQLNGMFAIALWDSRSGALLLARDRMGVKPLYWARCGSRVLFASELKSLLACGELDAELDFESLADYLRFSYIPREFTPYKQVRRLLPGYYLKVGKAACELSQWWSLSAMDAEPGPLDARGLTDLEALFDDAVKLRMRSDVPVASFLSGGLDSSLVTITAQASTDIPMQTFTVGFEDSELDELPYAREVAQQAATIHRELTASKKDALTLLPRLMWHMDEPLGDSSIIPSYLISGFAAARVKVCLSGLGGDELFGGYARYVPNGIGRIRRLFQTVPTMAGRLAPLLENWAHPWAEQLRLASGPAAQWRSYIHQIQIFLPDTLRHLGLAGRGRGEDLIADLWRRYPGSDPVSRRQFIDQHTYLPDQILALTDRMSMANSLEVRVPFLDYRLVRFSQRISSEWKQNEVDFKIGLRAALGKRCPPSLLSRRKWGFDTPLRRWIGQTEIVNLLQQLSKGWIVREGVVRAGPVAAITKDGETIRRNARRVWNLLALETWLRVRKHSSAPRENLPDSWRLAA
jgi:asparagine synthase (glutamine-hydrolysing)